MIRTLLKYLKFALLSLSYHSASCDPNRPIPRRHLPERIDVICQKYEIEVGKL